jgi:hypothetical protein
VHRLDRAGNARTHVHPLNGFQASRELVPCQRFLGLHRRDRNRDGRRRALRTAVGTRPGNGQVHKQHGPECRYGQDGSDAQQIPTE